MTDQPWAPTGMNMDTPNVARMYDYYLGGKNNYAVDREAAETVLAAAPEGRLTARANRAFLRRSVRFLAAEAGIRQFIDIGTGLPTQGNVHEVAHEVAPDARVVYVDNDQIVLAHSRALLSGSAEVTTIQGDLRQPEKILHDPGLRKLIDLDQPVAVLLLSVLHFITDDENPAGIVARLRDAMAPGSYLVMAHGTAEERPQEGAAQITRIYAQSTSKATLRSREHVRRFFDGFELVEPGLVYLHEWRPDLPDAAKSPAGKWGLAGLGRKI